VPKMPGVGRRDVGWVTPKLVCEVEFAEWTHDDRLRAPVYKGLRDDKKPGEVRRERPVEREIRRGSWTLTLRNLDKVFWPQGARTKGDLLRHYARLAPLILPVIADRPLVMKRLPNGVESKAFYQHRAPEPVPPGVRIETLPDDDERETASPETMLHRRWRWLFHARIHLHLHDVLDRIHIRIESNIKVCKNPSFCFLQCTFCNNFHYFLSLEGS